MSQSYGKPDTVQRTSLTGKPLKREHDPFTNMMSSVTDAGVNHLPAGYTDSSLVQIPIKLSDIGGPLEEEKEEKTGSSHVLQPEKKGGFFRRLSGQRSDRKSSSSAIPQLKVVKMSRGDYLKYWAKGEDGQYLDSVVEPDQGRRQWVIDQLEIAKDW